MTPLEAVGQLVNILSQVQSSDLRRVLKAAEQLVELAEDSNQEPEAEQQTRRTRKFGPKPGTTGPVVSVKEAAKMVGCHYSVVYGAAKSGRIAVKQQNPTMLSVSSVQAFGRQLQERRTRSGMKAKTKNALNGSGAAHP